MTKTPKYLIQNTRSDFRVGKQMEEREKWGISAITASPGLHLVFPFSAEWKNESVGAADVCAAAVIWWRLSLGGVTALAAGGGNAPPSGLI